MPSTDSDNSKPLPEVSLPLSFSALAIPRTGDPVSLQRKTISRHLRCARWEPPRPPNRTSPGAGRKLPRGLWGG